MKAIENVKQTVVFRYVDVDIVKFSTVDSSMVVRHMVGERIKINGAIYEVIDSNTTYDTETAEYGGLYSDSATIVHIVQTYYVNKIFV
ncbi:hypothetical protein [Bacillus paranthracis]|uniref:hypothetical protein n=1 Tax=Bacillus paranthracis TaxID=2026186 RepID=UPI0021FE835F|nr:hypothetical protein [Bacillus paranthracis]UXR28901.1 hypothetical protein [Bacillus phage Nachito]